MDPTLIVTSVIQLVDLAIRLRASLKQSGEWTPEQEAEFSARIARSYAEPHWQPSHQATGSSK